MLRMGVKGYVTVTVTGLLVNQSGSISPVVGDTGSVCHCVNTSVPLIAAVVLIVMVTWLGSTAVVPSIVAPTIVLVLVMTFGTVKARVASIVLVPHPTLQ